MDTKQTVSEGLTREFEIVMSAKELDDKISERLHEVANTAAIKGFRPGKIPLSVARARFGEQVKGEVIKTNLDQGAKDIVENNALHLASQPHLDIVSYDDGQDLIAKLVVEIMPEIMIPDLASLEIERPHISDNETEIETTLKRLADENRPTKSVKRKAKNGDIVVLDFTGRIDGEAFEGGAAQDHRLELGTGSFIAGFEEGLVGAEAGKTYNIDVKFPDDYQANHLANKIAVFECLVKDVHEKTDAVIDQGLAEKLGFESLDKLREAIAGQMRAQHDNAIRGQIKTVIFDQLAEKLDFEVPPSLLKSEYEALAHSMHAEHDHNHDDKQQHNHDTPLDADQEKEAQSLAIRRVRLGLLLAEIGSQNKIEVSEDDKRQALIAQARRFPGQEQQVFEYYTKNPQAMQELSGPLFEERVVDYILELAKVTEKPMSADEFYNTLEVSAKKPDSAKKIKKAPAKKTASAKKTVAPKKQPVKKAAKAKATKKS